MNKTKTHRRNYDLSADLEKIKNAFSEAAMDVKEKTNDQLSQSMTEIKDQSVQVQNKIKKYIRLFNEWFIVSYLQCKWLSK